MRWRKVASASPVVGDRSWLRRWWLDRPVRTKGLIVVAIPLITLITVTSAGLVLGHSEHQERTISTRANDLVRTADQVLFSALNAETGIRGYALTRDPVFLQPYNTARARIGAERSALRRAAIAAGVTRPQRILNAIVGRAFAEFARVRSAIGRAVTVRALHPALLTGKATMDRVRRQVAGLTSTAVSLVIPRRNQLTSLETTAEVLDIAGLALGLLAWPASPCLPLASPAGSPRPRRTLTGLARACHSSRLPPRPTISGAWRTRSCMPAASSPAGRPSGTGRGSPCSGRSWTPQTTPS